MRREDASCRGDRDQHNGQHVKHSCCNEWIIDTEYNVQMTVGKVLRSAARLRYQLYHCLPPHTRHYRVFLYQPSVHGVIWSSLVRDHFAEIASSMQKRTMTFHKQQGTEPKATSNTMPFFIWAASSLLSVSPSSTFYHGIFFKHGGYAISFTKSKQGNITLSEV